MRYKRSSLIARRFLSPKFRSFGAKGEFFNTHEITGLRRGEKLSEVLLENPAELLPTEIERIKAIRTRAFDVAAFNGRLQMLERAAWDGNTDDVYRQIAANGYWSYLAGRAAALAFTFTQNVSGCFGQP